MPKVIPLDTGPKVTHIIKCFYKIQFRRHMTMSAVQWNLTNAVENAVHDILNVCISNDILLVAYLS